MVIPSFIFIILCFFPLKSTSRPCPQLCKIRTPPNLDWFLLRVFVEGLAGWGPLNELPLLMPFSPLLSPHPLVVAGSKEGRGH